MKKQTQNSKSIGQKADLSAGAFFDETSFDKEAVIKTAKAYANDALSAKEKKAAEEMFTTLLAQKDKNLCSVLVAQLEKALYVKPALLSDLMALDSETAATVVNKFRAVNDAFLEKIIEKKKYLPLIAERTTLSSNLMKRLIQKGDVSVVQKMIANENLLLTDGVYDEILKNFAQNETIQRALLTRQHVPMSVLEKLLPFMGDDVKRFLLVRRDLPVQLVTSLVSQTREKSILTLSEKSTEDEVRMLVIHLESADRLTPNLILRSVCTGDMKFFEYALAIKAGIPIRNARILIYDSGDYGLERLYEESDLPAQMYPAVRLAVRTFSEMLKETEDGFHDHFTRRLVERLMVLFDQHHIKLTAEDTDYFIQRTGQKTWTVCPELI